jgi:hypothetical protein
MSDDPGSGHQLGDQLDTLPPQLVVKESHARKVAARPSETARLSQLDPDLGNFADGLNGNWLIGLVRSRKNSGKAAAVPTK